MERLRGKNWYRNKVDKEYHKKLILLKKFLHGKYDIDIKPRDADILVARLYGYEYPEEARQDLKTDPKKFFLKNCMLVNGLDQIGVSLNSSLDDETKKQLEFAKQMSSTKEPEECG